MTNKNSKRIKGWAVMYKSSMGFCGVEWRLVYDQILVNYPRIFMNDKEAENYIIKTKNKNLRIIPCQIILNPIKRKR